MSKHKRKKEPEYVFRRHASIGAADAEDDSKFLSSCFVDTGDLDVLRDCENPKRIVVGRTGVGKSALLKQLCNMEDHVIELPPEVLSLNYICNSDILNFFETAGVKLDIFYQLLWRHVFSVELLRHKYGIRDERSKNGFLERMRGIFSRDKNKEKAIEYLQQWGEKFWQETEYRIKEFTAKLESDLKAQVGTDLRGLSLSAGAAEKLTEEQKTEIIHKGQRVVNSVQIKDLGEVVRLLAEDVFTDPQERFYITIDRLDENWAEEKIRFKLIRALIETIRHFQKVRHVKIIIVIRTDLLERVYQLTRDSGFQEEKYESLYLHIRWAKDRLEQLLDLRVQALVREQYTKQPVHLKQILPKRVGSKPAIDYILDRTFMRPRDAILFLNTCLERAEGRPDISLTQIRSAEGEYSAKRLRSLHDEWNALFPSIIKYSKVLEGREFPFKIRAVNKNDVENFILEMCGNGCAVNDPVYIEGQKYMDGKRTLSSFLNYLFGVYYRLGLVGIKTDSHTPCRWSYLNESVLHEGEIKPSSSVYVHPTYWRVLGIKAEDFRGDLSS